MPSLSPCQQQSSEQIGCWNHRRDENSWRISSPSQQQWRKHWQLVPACQRWGQSWWQKQLLAAQRALPEVPTLSLLTVQWGLSTQPVICLPCISSERQQLKIYSEYCEECLMTDFISLFFNKGKKLPPFWFSARSFYYWWVALAWFRQRENLLAPLKCLSPTAKRPLDKLIAAVFLLIYLLLFA